MEPRFGSGPIGREKACTLGFGNVLKASFPLELARNRGNKIDGKDALNVHEILQLMPVEMVLLDQKVVPVSLSARKHNTRETIGR